MIKNNMKYKAIRIIAIIFLVNVILISAYCNIFLNKNMKLGIDATKDKINDDLNIIIEELESQKNIDKDLLENISNKYGVELYLEDSSNNIVYSNIEEHNFNYSKNKLININNKSYSLMISKELDVSVSSIIKKLLFLELFIILLTAIVVTVFVNKKILKPIFYLRYDMLAYKNGILPKFRPKKQDIYELQNYFVNLTEALEEEKQKHNGVIASISHDIKTPLTSILGYTSRLENANLSEEVKQKYIVKIGSKALAMKEIMDEFDDYLGSSLNGNLHKEPITSKELFRMIENDYEDDLEDKHIKLKLKNNVKKGVLVVDINKLKRVFSNIIGNSVRHMNKEEGLIVITLNKRKNYYEFSISDNGEGIKEENIHKIFDPLFTTDPSRKISGLGLSICKQIIELHDGEIYAKNNRNAGVTITFKIKDNKE